MSTPLEPAALAFTAAGTPWSAAHGDIYHSADGGTAQANHVFLGGNRLPDRWRERARFTILETGFGLGLNFLATWQAWRDDPGRCARLDYVSLEKHPFRRADLAALHARLQAFAPRAAELEACWPLLVPGVHRLEFDAGRVVLTLVFGDAVRTVPRLRLAADAFYLDGFSPAKNPELWDAAMMRGLARLAVPGATAATWSAARGVREAIADAGFEVELAPGFGAKREMTVARHAPRRARATVPSPADRRAIVIGAGLAGAAVCERLCARGWQVTLIDRQPRPAAETSGNHAGVFHPVVTPDDSHLARLTRAGTLAALARWRALEAAGARLRWDCCGVLQLARDAREEAAQRSAAAQLGLPPDWVSAVTREEASAHAGLALAAGGLWFPGAGWMRPVTLVEASLAACGARLETRYDCDVAALERLQARWQVRDTAGVVIAEAPVVVLANALGASALAPRVPATLRSVRGQLSHLPAARIDAPHAVVLRGGALLPAIDGLCMLGASYDFDDDDPRLREDSHAGNLERLARMVPALEQGVNPALAQGVDPAALDGRVAFRAVSPDRLPLIGAMPATADGRDPVRLRDLARAPGLYGAYGYGSRGLVWSALGAELLASLIEGEPLPLEGDLVEALDPGRFIVRGAARGRPLAAASGHRAD